jgi:hypothetical protein
MITKKVEAGASVPGPKMIDQAVEVLAAVIWNIHLKRVLNVADPTPRLNFWRVIHGNQMDMAVIEWCKLFGSDHKEHQPVHWKNTIPEEEHDSFRQGLLRHLGITRDDWTKYRAEVKHYRDNHAAHLSVWRFREGTDDRFPKLEIALEASYYYYEVLLSRIPTSEHHYPLDIRDYSMRFVEQASKAAIKAADATADMAEQVL